MTETKLNLPRKISRSMELISLAADRSVQVDKTYKDLKNVEELEESKQRPVFGRSIATLGHLRLFLFAFKAVHLEYICSQVDYL
jgi:hypothetical protein